MDTSQLNEARAVISPNQEQQEIGLKWCHQIKKKMMSIKHQREVTEREKRKQKWKERLAVKANNLPSKVVKRDERFYENLQQSNHQSTQENTATFTH
ncbi:MULTISPECIES: hypothetical protein [Vibrio]|uniref:hypothetical protein n=1 Tax=Vibrio TaxID=662 RepID=UPI000B5CFBB6|nr:MULTISPECIES: hypothetical protein [Vibrio]HBV77633.1 hypothetical protein [Vibrio sp.]